jgi:hypothetical protein
MRFGDVESILPTLYERSPARRDAAAGRGIGAQLKGFGHIIERGMISLIER